MPKESAPETEFKEVRERIEYAARSLPSEDHPSWNEDAFRIDEENELVVLCDGFGGHIRGQEAANVAADAIVEYVAVWDDIEDEDPDDIDLLIKNGLRNAVSSANAKVIAFGKELKAKATEKEKEKWSNPGTTALAVKLRELADGKIRAYIASAGDCRVYVLRAKTGVLEQVTKDHDMLDDDKFLEAHFHVKLNEDEKNRLRAKFDTTEKDDELPAGFEREIFKMRNWVSSGLGESLDRAKIDTYSIDLEIGDRIIMTTDGVHDNLSSQDGDKSRLPSIAKIAKETETADECAAKITVTAHDYANLFSYKRPREPYEPYMRAHRDDMTVVAADIK